ncbi:hypothetical protein BC827DRAFT_506652 [Russula dissimulans]|nr:hypothetical protein BC827DRAFT_506652 [Russula dissimulans]
MTSPLSSVSSTSTSTSAPAGTSASFVFEPIPEMFTCGLANVQWTYVGPSAPLTFNISNVNVAQQAPLSSSSVSSSSSTASPSSSTTVAILDTTKRQFNGYDGSYLPSINVIPTDAAGLDPTGGNWTWGGVNVPQGWYEMLAYVQGVLHTSSNSFFVANGTNTNCITQFAARSPSNQVPTSTASPSAIVATSSGHSHAGAIAGGVIGGVAFLAAVIIAFLYMCVRRRNGRPRRGGGRRWSELSFRKLRRGSDTPSSLRPAEPCLEADQTFVGSDEELSALGHEKVVAAAQPAILPQRAYTPSRRASTQTNRSYNRATPNSEAPIRRTSYNPLRTKRSSWSARTRAAAVLAASRRHATRAMRRL